MCYCCLSNSGAPLSQRIPLRTSTYVCKNLISASLVVSAASRLSTDDSVARASFFPLSSASDAPVLRGEDEDDPRTSPLLGSRADSGR